MSDEADRAVLVTAATTAVGRAIVSALANDPRVRAVLAVRAPDEAPAPEQAAKLHPLAVDLTRYRDARELLLGPALLHGVDTVVHAPLHSEPSDEGKRVFRLNVESTHQLLGLCEEQGGIAHFVLRSFSDVYRVDRDGTQLIDEDQPLELSPDAPQSVRDHAQADLTACARVGQSRLRICVLRCAEILAAGAGTAASSGSRAARCPRPLGYDPMLNLLSLRDAGEAVALAAFGDARGPFNVPGYDSLPLSELVHLCGRVGVPLPGPLLQPLYALRARAGVARYRYAADRRRMHYGRLLDGARAAAELGYEPRHPIAFARLFAAE